MTSDANSLKEEKIKKVRQKLFDRLKNLNIIISEDEFKKLEDVFRQEPDYSKSCLTGSEITMDRLMNIYEERETYSKMTSDTNLIKELNTLSDSELTELQNRLKITPDMRIHMSKDRIQKLEKRYYTQRHDDKPDGFWYGFGNEWIDWTDTAGPERKGKYIYEIDINDSNILQIKDYPELIEFTKEYKSINQIIPRAIFSIDWSRIEFKYDGIEINPYIEQARMGQETLWYYSWDVASGCIWNLNKVKIELIGLLN